MSPLNRNRAVAVVAVAMDAAIATSTPLSNGVNHGGSGDVKPKSAKGVIEKTYQKKSQLEHILLRPDTYIGNDILF